MIDVSEFEFHFIHVTDCPTEEEIIEFYQKLLWSSQVSVTTKQYTLISLIKLSTRLRSGQE